MNANVKDCLAQLDKIYKAFTHRGSSMTKKQSKEVLEYAVSKGYKNIYDIPDVEIDKIISK